MGSTVIDTGELLRVRNDHPELPLVIRHQKRVITIGPGEVGLVPFEPIRVWWGDPRARAGVYVKFSDSLEKGYVNKREDEIRRLGVRYGSYASDVVSLNSPDWPPQDKRFNKVPKRTPWPITIQTQAGQPVVPCGLDMTGEDVYPAVRDDSEDLNDEVNYREHLEQELDRIKSVLARVTSGMVEDDAEVDTPTRV